MDEIILEPLPGNEGSSPAEFFLGEVTAWSVAEGASIKPDGQSSGSTKRYKIMRTSRPLVAGNRYLIMKQSGTYIVLGEVGMPTPWRAPADLANDAALSDVITKINTILAGLRDQGIFYMPT